MSRFDVQHRAALAQVKLASPTPVTITKGATVVVGYATPLKPNIDRYTQLNLNTAVNITLCWIPETRGQLPLKDGTLWWSGVKYSVAEPNPYDPDGAGALYCELIGTR